MKSPTVWIALLLVSTSAAAQMPGPKRPWQYSTDERIELLRNRTDSTVKLLKIEDAGFSSEVFDVDLKRRLSIHGEATPELFFPHELFVGLMDYLDVNSLEYQHRDKIAKDIQNAGLDPQQFWPEVRDAVSDYLDLRTEQLRLLPLRNQPSNLEVTAVRRRLAEIEELLCPARTVSMRKAREKFGDRFDQVLYTAVAPHLSSSGVVMKPETAEWIHWIERGCR